MAVGLGALAYAAAVLWTVPGFLHARGPAALSAAFMAAGAATAYAAVGAHPGTRRWRAMVPTIAVGLACLSLLARVPWTGWDRGVQEPALHTAAGIAAWLAGQSPVLHAPAAWLVLYLAGVAVGLLIFPGARGENATPSLATGFIVLAIEWEFIDPTARQRFWVVAAVALFWLSAQRARSLSALPTRSSVRPWMVLASGLLLSAVVAAILPFTPRQAQPADLGAVGIWASHLPLIGRLERGTRGGNLGAGSFRRPGSEGSGSSPSGSVALAQDGFSLADTGFSPSVANLGGPVRPTSTPVFVLGVDGTHPLPSVLYLRGAVRDIYTGSGWAEDPSATNDDPTWPIEQAGPLADTFLRGATLPPPYHTVQLRLVLRQPSRGNLFTLLSPLGISAPVWWDQTGEVWTSGAMPSGYVYHLTAAVLGPDVYTSTDLAPYSEVPDAPKASAITPFQAMLRDAAGGKSYALPGAANTATGTLPLAADLQLPASLPAPVRSLATQWTVGQSTPLLEALAIDEHLQAYPYALDAPAPPSGVDFTSFFLFQAKRGYCTYYSTAMVVLLRSIGIPARWVEGFRVPVPASGGTFLITDAQAHAWVEAYIPPFGWLTFDPTPDVGTPTPATVATGVPGPATIQALAAHLGAIRRIAWEWLLVLPVLALVALAASVARNVWHERHLPENAEPAAEVLWQACERVGARFGRPRRPEQTPREYAMDVGLCYPALEVPARDFAEAFGQLRYGPGAPQQLERMRRSWSVMQGAWHRTHPFSYHLRRWL